MSRLRAGTCMWDSRWVRENSRRPSTEVGMMHWARWSATVTVADHRAQCIIPTSVEGRRLFSRTQRESHIHVPARSRLIIAPIRGVDNHRSYVGAIPDVVEPHERP